MLLVRKGEAVPESNGRGNRGERESKRKVGERVDAQDREIRGRKEGPFERGGGYVAERADRDPGYLLVQKAQSSKKRTHVVCRGSAHLLCPRLTAANHRRRIRD